MPLVVLIWVYIIWIVIKKRQYLKKQKEDEMWRSVGEYMDKETADRERLKNSYTIED